MSGAYDSIIGETDDFSLTPGYVWLVLHPRVACKNWTISFSHLQLPFNVTTPFFILLPLLK